jgi:hypothetical protein
VFWQGIDLNSANAQPQNTLGGSIAGATSISSAFEIMESGRAVLGKKGVLKL